MLIHSGHFVETPPYRMTRKEGTRSWLITLTLAGSGQFGHSRGAFVAKEGDAVLLRNRTFHDYMVTPGESKWEFLWCHFHPWAHWLPYLEWPAVGEGLYAVRLTGKPAEELRRGLLDAVHFEATDTPYNLDRAMNALERGLVAVAEGLAVAENPTRRLRVSPSLALIERHLASPLPIQRLAAACGLSESRFAHLFREETGYSPRAFLETQRIARAKQLLALTPWPLQRVAEECGYPNAFYMSTRFTKAVGVSPSDFRSLELDPDRREAVL